MPIKCPVAPLEFTFLADAYFTQARHPAQGRDRLRHPAGRRVHQARGSPANWAACSSERDIHMETDFAVERRHRDSPAGFNAVVSYDERRIPFDLLVSIPLNMGPDYIARSGLGDDMNYVPPTSTRCARDHDDIFVLGDAA
jgi:sulfide:quinone oxidoreductase